MSIITLAAVSAAAVVALWVAATDDLWEDEDESDGDE